MKNAYLVYYGPPILRSNPMLRTRITFVGVLLYEEEDWSLCISTYLGTEEQIHDAWDRAEKNRPENKGFLSTSSDLGPGFDKAYKIYNNSIATSHHDDVVCRIISKLCDVTQAQNDELSNFLEKNQETYRTLWRDDVPPSWPFDIRWIITFKKGVLSCWKDGTNAFTRKEIKIIENIKPGKEPKFVIDNTANKKRVPRDDESSQIDAPVGDDNFLLVTYPQRTEGGMANRYDFLKTETKKTFFGDADRAPETADEDYIRFLRNDAARNLSKFGNMKDVVKYLKEISEPGQDFTSERRL